MTKNNGNESETENNFYNYEKISNDYFEWFCFLYFRRCNITE